MNKVFLELGPINIYWYSILILIAIIIGIFLARHEARRIGLGASFLTDLAFYLIVVAIIGARLYYVIFNFQEFASNPIEILYVWEGGLAIYGGIIAGIIFIIDYCKRKGRSTLKTMDVIVPSLILGQAIGRWGNFINGEAYGSVVSLEFLNSLHLPQFIIDGMYINGAYHHPTFLYESLWCLIGFVVLLIIRHVWKGNKEGNLTFIYFIWYGIGRFFIEGLRTDSLYFETFRVSQIVSLGLVIVGLIGLIFSFKRKKYFDERDNIYVK